jgi:hypothetical protein
MPITIKAVEDQEFAEWITFAKKEFVSDKLNSKNMAFK